MVLPENIDASYPDRDPGDAAHQQHHDEIHAAINGLSVSYVARGVDATVVPNHAIIGHPAPSVPDGARVGLEARLNINDPNTAIQQHFVGYSFYTGTPGPSSGSLQGGSCESSVFNNGTGDITPAVLGFEGIGAASGDNGNKVGTVIGISGTAFVNGEGAGQSVDNLISLQASGPRRDSGAGSVLNAYSLRVQPPATGTNRYSAHITGRTRLVTEAGRNAFEVANESDTLQWACDGAKLVGYASDGASERFTLDPQDGAAERFKASWFNGTVKGIVLNDIGAAGTGNAFEYQRGGTPKFAVLADGGLYLTQAVTTTAPAAGGAGALPATPTEYMTISVNGVSRKVALY